jgi:hypothetical protein
MLHPYALAAGIGSDSLPLSTDSEIDDGSGFGFSMKPSSGRMTRKCRK